MSQQIMSDEDFKWGFLCVGFLLYLILSVWFIFSASNQTILILFFSAIGLNIIVCLRLLRSKVRISIVILSVCLLLLPISIVSLRAFFSPTFSNSISSPGADLFGGSPNIRPPFPEAGKEVIFHPPIEYPKIDVIGNWAQKTTVQHASPAQTLKGTWVTHKWYGEVEKTEGYSNTEGTKSLVKFVLAPITDSDVGLGKFILKNQENESTKIHRLILFTPFARHIGVIEIFELHFYYPDRSVFYFLYDKWLLGSIFRRTSPVITLKTD